MSDTSNRTLVMTRTFNAPRELVFKAWTERNHVDQWWEPTGLCNATMEMDMRPGGMWRYIMHGPDGVDYPNRVVYYEVVAPERLVYTHSSDIDNDAAAFQVTVTFSQQGDQTVLTMHFVFTTAAQRQAVVQYGAVEGGQQTLERLAAYLTSNLIQSFAA